MASTADGTVPNSTVADPAKPNAVSSAPAGVMRARVKSKLSALGPEPPPTMMLSAGVYGQGADSAACPEVGGEFPAGPERGVERAGGGEAGERGPAGAADCRHAADHDLVVGGDAERKGLIGAGAEVC